MANKYRKMTWTQLVKIVLRHPLHLQFFCDKTASGRRHIGPYIVQFDRSGYWAIGLWWTNVIIWDTEADESRLE